MLDQSNPNNAVLYNLYCLTPQSQNSFLSACPVRLQRTYFVGCQKSNSHLNGPFTACSAVFALLGINVQADIALLGILINLGVLRRIVIITSGTNTSGHMTRYLCRSLRLNYLFLFALAALAALKRETTEYDLTIRFEEEI